MVDSSRVVSASYFLDPKKEYKLFLRFVYSEDFSGVDEFAISLVFLELEKYYEIVRCDCARDEALHVHYFYNSPPKKVYLADEVSIDTMKRFALEIENNLEDYAKKYFKFRYFGKG